MSKITIDIQDLEHEFAMLEPESDGLRKIIAEGIIFGKSYQVHVIITTNESEFIESEN